MKTAYMLLVVAIFSSCAMAANSADCKEEHETVGYIEPELQSMMIELEEAKNEMQRVDANFDKLGEREAALYGDYMVKLEAFRAADMAKDEPAKAKAIVELREFIKGDEFKNFEADAQEAKDEEDMVTETLNIAQEAVTELRMELAEANAALSQCKSN